MGAREAMFGRIVVAYDGSPSAQDALALAQRLREPIRGELLLTCVVLGGPLHPRLQRDKEAAALGMLADARAQMPPGVPVRLHTPMASSPARGITELAEEVGADLIAIGSEHGAAGKRIGLTRTAGRLLHGAPCAVAIAPPGARDTDPFRHVGVALDESPESSAALEAAYAIARQSGCAMTLYSALDDLANPTAESDPKLRIALQKRLDDAADAAPPGINPRTVLLHGAAGRVIAGAADGVVDLLVTGSRTYGPVQRALLGSVSEELIARATHPVLVLPRQAAPAKRASPAPAGV